MRRHTLLLIVAALFLPLSVLTVIASQPGPIVLEAADKLFEDKHYQWAAKSYEQIIEQYPEHATQRRILCYLRLQQFDKAIETAKQNIERLKNKPYETSARQQLGNLYMLIPHWGMRQGGVFKRNQHGQGSYLQTHQHDKKLALEQLEKARELYAQWDGKTEIKDWRQKRIKNLFALSSAAAAFGIFDSQPYFWHAHWNQRDDAQAQTTGETDFAENAPIESYRNILPVGLQVDKQNKPIFPAMPKQWNAQLPDDEKVLFLLSEIRQLDQTNSKRFANLSLYRQAMLARKRFGLDRISAYSNILSKKGKAQNDAILPWELGDHQAMVLVNGSMRVATLPAQWDIVGLLDQVQGQQQDDAIYAKSLYHQSRKQYVQALAGYKILLKNFKDSKHRFDAMSHNQAITAKRVNVSVSGVQLTGKKAKINVEYRNTNHLWFVAYRFDLPQFLRGMRASPFDSKKHHPVYHNQLNQWAFLVLHSNSNYQQINKLRAASLSPKAIQWNQPVPSNKTHRRCKATLDTPLHTNGIYVVYAYTSPPKFKDLAVDQDILKRKSRGRSIVAISDLAMVHKKTDQGHLYFIADAHNGKPIADAKVSIFQSWHSWNKETKKTIYHKQTTELTTDANGMTLFNPDHKNKQSTQLHIMISHGDRFGIPDMGYWNPYHSNHGKIAPSIYCITDRPVYRPGQTVKFKAWLRTRNDGQWVNLPQQKIDLEIYDARRNKIKTMQLTADDFGGVNGQIQLTKNASLGQYQLRFKGRYNVSTGTRFRVEEYKKPEFEVTVKTSKQHVKLGQTLKADIQAKYYFGQPVTDAKVTYKIFRQSYTHQQIIAGPWDWLYGKGYGLSWYESPWFNWWDRGCVIAPNWWYRWYPYWQRPNARELVKQGAGKLNQDGKLIVEIDTAKALKQHGDQDHRYFIEAQVTDKSRRAINGSGSVIATSQSYFASIQTTQGYYTPNEQIKVKISCQYPDGKPVQTKGQLVVSQVNWIGPYNKTINEIELDRQIVQTDKNGIATIEYRSKHAGQLKFHFAAPDTWGQQVQAHALTWIAGNHFTGKLHRFNDLEIITDKRNYEPGQTAHVMINTKQANSYILLSTDTVGGILSNWQLVHIPNKSKIIDIPITNKHRPNFFIEATTIANANMYQQMAQICVPPAKSLLDISVQTDKQTYQPGQTATVHITAKDHQGKPAIAQIALSAYDRSLLYIAKQSTGRMGSYFYGKLNHHRIHSTTNLKPYLSITNNNLYLPLQLNYLPIEWHGTWRPRTPDWRTITALDLKNLGMQYRKDAERFPTGDRMLRRMQSMAKISDMSTGSVLMEVAAPQAMMSKSKSDSQEDHDGSAHAPTSMRENFADTALWLSTLTTDSDGKATATFTVPDNLTTWQIGTWAMSKNTQVGQGSTQTTATKDLLVRLQTPRFLVQRDELLLTANVHNYLNHQTTVTVDLQIPHDLLTFVDRKKTQSQVTIPAGGQATLNWHVKAMNQGMARIAVTAKSKDASDAMALTIPVLVHGSKQQIANTAIMQSDELDQTIKIELDLPKQIQDDQTELHVTFTPTLIGSMLNALPYLLEYPYGCTEQTVSRFVPAVQVRKTLRDMGLNLKDIKQQFPIDPKTKKALHPWHNHPIFDDDKMDQMINEGLARILSMQNGDGGWGWWKDGQSRIYLTTHVLYALQIAEQSGVDINKNILRRATNWLKNAVNADMQKEHWQANTQTAYAAYVLAIQKQNGPWVEKLYVGRDQLNLYGKALLSLTFHELGQTDKAKTVLQNIMQYRKDNLQTQLSWFDMQNGGGWWYWYRSDIETHAWILRAMTTITPKDEASPRLVKWLMNHRQHGSYWRSTRDTAMCIDAMNHYINSSTVNMANYTLTLSLDDGAVTKTVKINKDNLLTHDNTFVIKGLALPAGKHTLTVRKQGLGELYISSRLSFFGMQEHLPAYGHELHLKRTYYRLKQIPFHAKAMNQKGKMINENRLRYERIEIKDGDPITSGELVQVELNLNADNDYTYLAIEDFKPAGCEPVDLQSGYVFQEGFGSYRELRDQKTMFFIEHLGQGDHLLRYRIRAEIPGVFHALPARVFAMYVPRLEAGSHELIMKIVE